MFARSISSLPTLGRRGNCVLQDFCDEGTLRFRVQPGLDDEDIDPIEELVAILDKIAADFASADASDN